MINTYRELLEATLAKYEGAALLAKRANGYCIYGHEINGVGCAIGCHLPASVASNMDELGGPIWNFVEYDRYSPLAEYFNLDKIDTHDLMQLQAMHDEAQNVDDFRARLRRALEG